MSKPRHLVLPAGIETTGWPAVQQVSAEFGVFYDEWQQDLNRAILGKRSDGLYAADTVVMSIPRQAGKTFNVGSIVFADCIIHPGTTTVWTAHQFSVSRETFNEMRARAMSPELAPHIDEEEITTAAGNECIPFRNGSRILFKARERGAIRGFTKVRRLVIDEAQILTEAAMADLVPTTNQAVNPQIVLMGTPPKPRDPSEVFSSLRAQALDGGVDGLLYVEYSAERNCDPDDWANVADANPSFPVRTGKRAVQRLRKLLVSNDDFMREALGIWGVTSDLSVIDETSWGLAGDSSSLAVDGLVLSVDVHRGDPETAKASVGLAGKRADGLWHMELDEHRNGTGWIPAWVADRVARNEIRGVVLGGRSSDSMAAPLLEAGVRVTLAKDREMASACALVFDGIMESKLKHTNQPQLNVALSQASKKGFGNAYVWNPKSQGADITPLWAATLALWGAQQPKLKRPGRGSGRASGGRRAVVM